MVCCGSGLVDETLSFRVDERPSPTAPKRSSWDSETSPPSPRPSYPGAPMAEGPKVVEPEVSQAELHKDDIIEFRDFLRSLLMHGAVGTAIGGCSTMVGEPQNLVSFITSLK